MILFYGIILIFEDIDVIFAGTLNFGECFPLGDDYLVFF